MTNEHVITKEMIKQKITIDIYYDSQSKYRKIELNPEERLIKKFTDIQISVTLIEIISKDNISKNYFSSPLIDHVDNHNQSRNKKTSTTQHPRGATKHSHSITKNTRNKH